jgi:hypothetical protein
VSKNNPREFERWRKLMVGGAVVLLLTTILKSSGTIGSGLLYGAGLAGGYILLVVGFGASFRHRREQEQAEARERENDPPVTGS